MHNRQFGKKNHLCHFKTSFHKSVVSPPSITPSDSEATVASECFPENLGHMD